MDSATQQMLDAVRRRMANLEQIQRLILEEFGESNERNGTRATRTANTQSPQAANGVSRKTQLHDWLKKNGPATRAQIIEGSGLPGGTVGGYLSAQKELFENRDGKWHAL